MPEKTLADLFTRVPVREVRGDMRRAVRGIAYDSRDAGPGFLFAAMDGLHTDGHRYAADAVRRGATAVMHARPLSDMPPDVTCIQVPDPRTALSPVSAAFFDHPSRSIRVIGVTGTDGKSSTVWFITQLIGFLGRRAGFLSTVSFKTGAQVVKNPFRQSTPEATEIHGMLREMVERGQDIAVVEATSHGLSQRMNRLGDVLFDAAVLTNVTHEHLEFHGSFEQYRSDKANLFRALSPDAAKERRLPAVCRRERRRSQRGVFPGRRARAGRLVRERGNPGRPRTCVMTSRARRSRLVFGGEEAPARVCIPGPFWVENSMAAVLAVSRMLDVPPLRLAPHLHRLESVPGRMASVEQGQPFAVIVDYAHTPGAFQKLFPWVRAHTTGKVTAVFGSAGERDREKRPLQGRAAADFCDTLVVTDEDPRGEDSMTILEQIAAGCPEKKRGEDLFLVPDRREALRLAFSRARPGDTVLLLGKGHEGSIIGPTGPMDWDEKREAEEALRSLGLGG